MCFRSVLKLAAVKSLEWRNPRQSFEVICDSLTFPDREVDR